MTDCICTFQSYWVNFLNYSEEMNDAFVNDYYFINQKMYVVNSFVPGITYWTDEFTDNYTND